MFDLFRSREKSVRILLGVLLGVIAITMVISLIPNVNLGNSTSADPAVLAEIGGEKITGQDAMQKFQQITQNQQVNAEMMAAYFPQFVEAMIQQRAAVYQAERMGLTVSDDEVLAGLQSQVPQLFKDGVLTDKTQLEQFFAAQNETVNDALDDIRKSILMKKLQDSTISGVIVSPQEVEAEYRKKYERAKIQYIAFTSGKFSADLKPTEDDLKAFFERNHAKYSIPEKLAYQVVYLDQDKVENTIEISDAQLRQAYSSSMDNFRMPERVHARHILIRTEGKSDAEKKTLLAKAEGLRKQLEGGADFEALAKANSEDTGTKDKGGDLGFFVRGAMVPEFDKMAFSLEPKKISPVVTTNFGYHIIQVIEKQPAKVQPFEDVKTGLLAELRKQQVADKMQTSADQIRAALAKDPASAEAVATKFGAQVATVPNASQGDPIPGLGASPEIDQTLTGLQSNGVSQVLSLPANRLAVVVLNKRTPARPALLDEVKDRVKSEYLLEKGQSIAHEKAVEAADRLKKGEAIEAVAKSMKLDVTTSSEFSRNDSVEGIGPAVYFEEAFTKPVGTILGPSMINNKDVVSKVVGRVEADMVGFAAEKDAILMGIKKKKAQDRNELLMDSILAKLTDDGKVKIHRDAIQRLLAQMRR